MATIGLDKLCYAMFTEDDRHTFKDGSGITVD